MRVERAESVANAFREQIQHRRFSTGMEYGCGTGLLGSLLQDQFDQLFMVDSSSEMLKMLDEKLQQNDISHLKTVQIDLMSEDAPQPVDVLFSLMVLHHVEDIALMLDRWITTVNAGGVLMISDIEEEDGSYHLDGDTWHNGINSSQLSEQLATKGLINIQQTTAYTIQKDIEGVNKSFPVFLITAQKPV